MKYLVGLLLILTFILISWGGLVHNTGSSLACPDWPLCYGQILPPMQGGILIEHTHRLLASLVGFLTVIILLLSYRQKNYKAYRKTIWLALGLVIAQGLLGGITVIFKLPTLVSTAHLAFSMLYFLTLIFLFHGIQLKEITLSSECKKKWGRQLAVPVFLIAILTYTQMLLGALIRHLDAGVACGLGPNNVLQCFDVKVWQRLWLPVSAPARLHMLHRYLGLVLLITVMTLVIKGLKKIKSIQNDLPLNFTCRFSLVLSGLGILVSLQVFLGLLTIGSALGVVPTTAHLSVATLLLGFLWWLYLDWNKIDQEVFPQKKKNLFKDLLDLTKPRLSSLVMFSMGAGILVAKENISWVKAFLGIVTTTFVVGGACAINCYLERDVDALMLRTQNRPLPAQRLEPKTALWMGIFLLVVFIPTLFFFVNTLTGILGFLAAFTYIFLYTPMKRKTSWALFVGAIPGAIPPMMGYTAVTNHLDSLAWFLFGILFIWQLPHFLAIALCYADQFRKAGIQIFPNHQSLWMTKTQMFFYSFSLLMLSIIFTDHSLTYQIIAGILGGSFCILSLWGFFTSSANWARQFFFASILYLPLLLVAYVFI